MQEEEEHILLNEDIELEYRIALEINQEQGYWINRVNQHLEKLLEKANKYNQLFRHMVHH